MAAHGELGIGYDVSAFAASPVPIDEDAETMRGLFEYLRGTVIADMDAYTSGAYDAGNDPDAAHVLDAAEQNSREVFDAQAAEDAFASDGISIYETGLTQRAFDVIEARDAINLASSESADQAEAWNRGVDIATMARFKREFDVVQVLQRKRLLGRIALQREATTGQ